MKPEALHTRIHSTIEGRILSGEWEPGRRVPSEAELMSEYGCARMTVSKALSALAGAGLIDRRKGAGSFVARPRARSLVLDVPDLAAEIEQISTHLLLLLCCFLKLKFRPSRPRRHALRPGRPRVGTADRPVRRP